MTGQGVAASGDELCERWFAMTEMMSLVDACRPHRDAHAP
jgi:hypothetical protein